MIDLIVDGDEDRARALLVADPTAAGRPGPAGVGLVRFALHHRMPALAADLVAAGAPLDPWDLGALGAVECLSAALDDDAELIGRRSADGFTLLHLTAYFGQVDASALLLNRCADCEAVADNATAANPLVAAAAGAHETIAHLLLDRGADPDARMAGGYTPLHAAAHRGHGDLVRLLLERGADPHARSDDGESAMDLAANQAEVVHELASV